jgi:4-hydroxy-tetrahydrodipicolinate synthase
MCNTFFEGAVMKAREIHLRLFPVVKALFLETNPIPVKRAMELMGMAAGKPRMPLVEMSEANTAILSSKLTEYGIKL